MHEKSLGRGVKKKNVEKQNHRKIGFKSPSIFLSQRRTNYICLYFSLDSPSNYKKQIEISVFKIK